VTAQPVEQKPSSRLRARPGFSPRSFRTILAGASPILQLFRKQRIAPAPGDEPFMAFASSSLQQRTLACQTGRGDELAATVDKVFAAGSATVTALTPALPSLLCGGA
jgi:hypothetical protein